MLSCLWGQADSILRIGCEVLERKNNQILRRFIFYKYLFRPICPRKEYGSLISEMYSVWRNPIHTTLLLNKFRIQTQNKYLF